MAVASYFTSNISGPPPGTATVGSELWIDLGLIPTGFKIWIGNATYTSPDKAVTFELRTNTAANSAGTTAQTLLLATCSASPKTGTITQDCYKAGRIHTATVIGTGVEHWWLRLTSKSGTAGSYLYSINYTTE